MTVANLIEKNGLDKIEMAVILGVGGDVNTGSHSYWVNGNSVDFGDNGEYANVEIVKELPENVFMDSDGVFWKVFV
jgi:hypothetical protein